jgi:hypothetical protein
MNVLMIILALDVIIGILEQVSGLILLINGDKNALDILLLNIYVEMIIISMTLCYDFMITCGSIYYVMQCYIFDKDMLRLYFLS